MPNAYYWLQGGREGGQKSKKTCLRNTWMFPRWSWITLVQMHRFSRFGNRGHWPSFMYGGVAAEKLLKNFVLICKISTEEIEEHQNLPSRVEDLWSQFSVRKVAWKTWKMFRLKNFSFFPYGNFSRTCNFVNKLDTSYSTDVLWYHHQKFHQIFKNFDCITAFHN